MTTTKSKITSFFSGAKGEQATPEVKLLPTRIKDGAPKGNRFLMHFVEGEVEIRHTNADNYPYINYRAEVDEPNDFAEWTVFGMFFFPRAITEDATEEEEEKYNNQLSRVIGQIDSVLGEGTCSSLDGNSLEECLEELVPLLEHSPFVGKVGRERGKKLDAQDDSKDAERYPDRNRITYFVHSDTWED